MVGLLAASSIFASLAKSHNPFRLIGVGLSVWTLAAAGCGSAFSFWFIIICRMLVGVGEASFISLAAPFIDDNAPVSQKTAWLAMFYMCIPTGVALGYVYGGLVGGHFNWRYAFWGEALLILPFAVFGFVVKPLQLKGFCPVESKQALTSVETVSAVTDDLEPSKLDGRILIGGINADELNKTSKSVGIHNILNQFSRFAKDMKVLLVDKVYVINFCGYIAYNFVIGAYSYWGPKAGYNIYHMKSADMMFGGITIVCGILGTISGGFILDRMSVTISNAFIYFIMAYSASLTASFRATFLGAIFCFVAFCLRSLYGFIVLFAVGSSELRVSPLCQTEFETSIYGHLYCLNSHLWRCAFLTTCWGSPGVFLHSVDKSSDESESEVSTITIANRKPLLDGNGDDSFGEV
ncbi:hypothetical protein CRYUN_Cryun22dG0081300 [Craigia yunnanensis]